MRAGEPLTGAELDKIDRLGAPSSARRGRFVAVVAVAAALATSVAVTGGDVTPVAAAGPTTSTLDGSSSYNAAASCWEIKQLHPASADGVYWLRTDTLQRPDEFYCDMTTDGGGWVLIGRGREGWTFRDYGQLTPQSVRSAVTGPAAFSPGALSSDIIDGLIDGGNVSDLTDGVRLRRASNIDGTAWQEIRWNLLDLTSWSWALGGGHRLASFSIDATTGTGSNTKDSKVLMPGEVGTGHRTANHDQAWFTYPWSAHGGQAGFSHSGTVSGANNSTSYLWELDSEDHAIPFTQVYLRPRLTTTAPAAIPASGLPETTLAPGVDDRPAEIAGGVSGVLKVGDTEPLVDASVLAITTDGNRVYVGGKFAEVRNTVTGNLEPQPYLAAFDRATGAWIPSFDPDLDGTVWDLKVAGGKLIVAGQFTEVDNTSLTAGIAALDLTTGDVVAGWRASLSLSGSTDRPYARALAVAGNDIYVGGNFTSITDAAGVVRSRGRAARISVSDGSANNAFLPDVNDGTVYDIDVAGNRVYIVGDFDGINANLKRGVGVLDPASGQNIAGLADPVWTITNQERWYQQAIAVVGAEVWQGGSEHNLHVYDANGYSYEKGYVTSGRGGDTQALALNNESMLQGSHGNSWLYHDTAVWPELTGFSRVDDYKWVGSFDTTTHEHDRSFAPSLKSLYHEGAWELHTDVDGCTWFGGDFSGGPYSNGQRQYLEGFSKFCRRDSVAPSVPTPATASVAAAGGIAVNWSASTDNEPGYIGYEVLRNDRVISPLVYGSYYVDPVGTSADSYFVRAVDPAGNRSATTAELVPADNQPPTKPTDLAATELANGSIEVTWTASTDNVGVSEYQILRNGVEIGTVAGAVATFNWPSPGAGSHWIQVRARDAAGNESYKTAPVRVDIAGPDTQAPSVPASPQASFDPATGIITFSWGASVDDVGVTSYSVLRNGVEVATPGGAATNVDLNLGAGGHYLQVRAFDAAGNASYKTPPVYVDVVIVGGPDTEAPSTPTGLAVTNAPNQVLDVSWVASTDNVGVDTYEILRNGVQVSTVSGATTSTSLTGLGVGNHYIQVRALDAAGNSSYKTAPVVAVIQAGDTSPPTTPTGVTATVDAAGTINVEWNASSDNVGVASYTVMRNLAVVATVPGGTLSAAVTGLGSGNHYIQVQAFDAAGNQSFRTAPVLVTI